MCVEGWGAWGAIRDKQTLTRAAVAAQLWEQQVCGRVQTGLLEGAFAK